MKGLHIIAEFHECACDERLLRCVDALAGLCRTSCQSAGLEIVAEAFHGFGTDAEPAGATGALVLAESHLAVHTWPELKAVTFDLYVCNFSRDNRQAAEAAYRSLLESFAPGNPVRRDIVRGGV